MTARFYFTPPKSTAAQVELAFWMSVKDSNSPMVLSTYLDRYPKGEFAPVVRALMEHYDRQLKLEQAKQEEARKLEEEAKRAADVKRLENEQRAREAAIAADSKRAEDARNSQHAKRVEQERADLLDRNEELRKALDEARSGTRSNQGRRTATASSGQCCRQCNENGGRNHCEEAGCRKDERSRKSCRTAEDRASCGSIRRYLAS